MTLHPRRLLPFVALVFATGCGTSAKPKPVAEGGSPFEARFVAAKAIRSNGERDDALAKLAVDAAAGGDAEVVKKSIDTISSNQLRDQVATQAALTLAKAGQPDAATEVAKLIRSDQTRDAALKKIAKGEY